MLHFYPYRYQGLVSGQRRFRTYVSGIEDSVAEIIARLLSLWKFAFEEVGNYEATRKLINVLPHYRKTWALTSLDMMVVEQIVVNSCWLDNWRFFFWYVYCS